MLRTLLALALINSAANAAKNPIIDLVTSEGKISIELNAEKAPKTVENFINYTKKKFYDGTVFHRVISTFMIQGGGFKATGKGLEQKKTKGGLKNESSNGLKNLRGTIAMARRADPDSASAQFFINVKDNDALDFPKAGGSGYAVFGKVIAGMDVVDKIKSTKTGSKKVKALTPDGRTLEVPFKDVPEKDVVISKATVRK